MTAFSISFISYGLLLFGLKRLPDQFWDSLIRGFDQLKMRGFHLKEKVPFLGAILRGEKLLMMFAEIEAKRIQGIKITPNNLVRYKFYTDLLEQLLESHRRQGIALKKCFPEIRQALLRDLQFEKKLGSEVLGAFMQFVVIAATTWGFVLLSSSLVKIPPRVGLFVLMIVLQFLGMVVFYHLVIILKEKTFKKFSLATQELYLFSTFLEAGMPLNEVMEHSQLMQGSLLQYKLFSHLGTRTKKLLERLKETGLSPKEELQEIIASLWHLQDEQFLKFTKIVQLLKFSALSFFFLPAYFLYLSSIFQFFMEQ